ncbi:MAG TPA: hypothetical protein VFG72_06100 [Marmoricola sp.]|nr:hypothetical protein [Marmoricola sp.]
MSARPSDWSALDRGRDPVPGDAEELAVEGSHYSTVAVTISDQVSRLRRIAVGEGLTGEYAESLRESSAGLAEDLEKAHGRFAVVGAELTRLVDDLATALTTTRAALDEAVTARAEMRQAEDAGYRPAFDSSSAGSTSEVDSALVSARKRYDGAVDDLAAAGDKCDRAVAAYDAVAAAAASRIRQASEDDLKDGRFEGFKAWVKANATWLRTLSTWLGRIVFALAVVIVLLSNPLGWLVAIALLAGVALLTVDTLLAVGGEGSWTDVAFSALGVLTLGAGSVAGKLAGFGRSLTLTRAGRRQGLRAGMRTLRSAFNNPGLRGVVTNLVNVTRPSTYANALDDGFRVATAVRSLPLQPAPFTLRSLLYGREAMSLCDDLARIRLAFGDEVVSGLHAGSVATVKALNGTSTVGGWTDTLMDEGVPVFRHLDDLTDRLTTREVSSW